MHQSFNEKFRIFNLFWVRHDWQCWWPIESPLLHWRRASGTLFQLYFLKFWGKGRILHFRDLEEEAFLTAFSCMHVLLEWESHYDAQVDLELLRSSEPPALAPQVPT